MHRRVCFEPISIAELTDLERKRAQHAIMLITKKRSGEIKGRAVFNGKNTRDWLSQEDTTSPTTMTEGLFITGVINAKEERNMMTTDVPNAFIQAEIPAEKRTIKKIIMKIAGRLVNYLVDIAPETYTKFVVYKNGKKVLYVEVLCALYRMLRSAMLWYNKF